jgi:hypothetical protein
LKSGCSFFQYRPRPCSYTIRLCHPTNPTATPGGKSGPSTITPLTSLPTRAVAFNLFEIGTLIFPIPSAPMVLHNSSMCHITNQQRQAGELGHQHTTVSPSYPCLFSGRLIFSLPCTPLVILPSSIAWRENRLAGKLIHSQHPTAYPSFPCLFVFLLDFGTFFFITIRHHDATLFCTYLFVACLIWPYILTVASSDTTLLMIPYPSQYGMEMVPNSCCSIVFCRSGLNRFVSLQLGK